MLRKNVDWSVRYNVANGVVKDYNFGLGTDKIVWSIGKQIRDEAHTMIAGTTGSGKSVFLNSIIWSLLPFPDFYVFIDLKRVELARYKNHPRCLAFIKEPRDVPNALDDVIAIMESRYRKMESLGQYTSDDPNIFVIIDELAETLQVKGVEEKLVTIMRLGRASKIHVIMATQSPNRKVITANIMQNVTCAVALRCNSAIESRQIIGASGAENLPRYGKGIMKNAEGLQYVTIPMTSTEDIENRVKYGI